MNALKAQSPKAKILVIDPEAIGPFGWNYFGTIEKWEGANIPLGMVPVRLKILTLMDSKEQIRAFFGGNFIPNN